MKIIKTFESFQNDIDTICKKYGIKNYTINSDGSIDVDGDVNLYDMKLTYMPLKFGEISGDFIIRHNRLKNFEGCPKKVGGDFFCDHNIFKSFEGCPKKVGGDFLCYNNQLTSFEGCPDDIGGEFFCSDNPIYELWVLFNDYSKIELFIDIDIVRDNKVIILQRLNEFLDMIGQQKVTKVKGYTCI